MKEMGAALQICFLYRWDPRYWLHTFPYVFHHLSCSFATLELDPRTWYSQWVSIVHTSRWWKLSYKSSTSRAFISTLSLNSLIFSSTCQRVPFQESKFETPKSDNWQQNPPVPWAPYFAIGWVQWKTKGSQRRTVTASKRNMSRDFCNCTLDIPNVLFTISTWCTSGEPPHSRHLLGHSKQRPLSKPVFWPSQMQSVHHSNIKKYSNCYTNILIPIMSNLLRLHVSPPISNRSGCTRISINPPSQDWKSE